MIFDADTHISPYKHLDIALSAEALDDRLEAAQIDRALCWLTPQGVENVSDSNRYIYESTKMHPRFLPFGWANVMEGEDKAVRDARVCMEEYGFRGVKLNGAQNYYPIDSLSAMRVCEVIAKNSGIIAFHIGTDEAVMTSPFRAAVVANAFPETPILMVHMGGSSPYAYNMSQSVIDVAKLCPNMYLIGSSVPIADIKNAVDTLGAARVLFGSDVPFNAPEGCIESYRTLLADYTPAQRGQIMYENAARLLLGT